MARKKVCTTFPKEGSHTLMLVSPIGEKAEKGLSRSGETGEEEEERMKDEEGEESEAEESKEGRKGVGRRSPKEPAPRLTLGSALLVSPPRVPTT